MFLLKVQSLPLTDEPRTKCLFLSNWLSLLTSIISRADHLRHSDTSFCTHQVQAWLWLGLPPRLHWWEQYISPKSVLNYQKTKRGLSLSDFPAISLTPLRMIAWCHLHLILWALPMCSHCPGSTKSHLNLRPYFWILCWPNPPLS